MTINGDLIIADSADKASLDGVTVTGRIVIRGGADAVSIKDSKAGKGVLVSSRTARRRSRYRAAASAL